MLRTVMHVVFFNTEPGKYSETFTKSGFRDWKHAMGKDGIISCHDNCKTHKEAIVFWHEYVKNTESGTTVDRRMDASRAKTISNNRHYLKIILECSQQEIALRGHRESVNSLNRGNFLEIFKLVASHDEVVSERLTYGPKNTLYTCPSIQNDLLKLMGKMVQTIVCCKVREAGLFSILVDETKDISKKEQITFVLR